MVWKRWRERAKLGFRAMRILSMQVAWPSTGQICAMVFVLPRFDWCFAAVASASSRGSLLGRLLFGRATSPADLAPRGGSWRGGSAVRVISQRVFVLVVRVLLPATGCLVGVLLRSACGAWHRVLKADCCGRLAFSQPLVAAALSSGVRFAVARSCRLGRVCELRSHLLWLCLVVTVICYLFSVPFMASIVAKIPDGSTV